MTREELIQKYRDFFESKGHKWILGASLVPENDPTVLFTTAGMHPMVPYLMGEKHPEGKRLADVQKCIRTGDIDEVGDAIHHTFFEMLGNWSLGDYFKSEAIEYSFEFLTSDKWLGIDKEKLAVSVFVGDETTPFDQESYDKWVSLGIKPERIAKLGKKDNWWGPAGTTGPCGPDTEMFFWTGDTKVPEIFDYRGRLPTARTGEVWVPEVFDPTNASWVEVWNDVFMGYNRTTDGKFVPLAQKNVDTGMGLARMLTVLNGLDDNYQTEIYKPIIDKIEEISGKKYAENKKEFRIIADHLTAAVFALSDGVSPSNKGAGYIVRRLIRRTLTSLYLISDDRAGHSLEQILPEIELVYRRDHPKLGDKRILTALIEEEIKFSSVLFEAVKMIGARTSPQQLFNLYQSHGLYLEIAFDVMAKRLGYEPTEKDKNWYREEFKKLLVGHQEKSRTASAGMFKGGLADAGEVTTKYHSATHLLQAALQKVLDNHVSQKGSNITPERTRFDFSHPEKMTEDQIKQVEELVNGWIKEDLPVTMEEMTVDEAKKSGAQGVFEDKYGSRVKVYSIGSVSREICGGPHVKLTGEIGGIKIIKEEASSAGVRRIKAVLMQSL